MDTSLYDTKLYLRDTYLYNHTSTIRSVDEVIPDKKLIGATHVLQLADTIFHPQGGGQPADTGTISCSCSSFRVTFVQGGLHYGFFEVDASIADFLPGSQCILNISSEVRLLHARLHSAGHAIDAAMLRCGLYSRVKALKGYHFSDGAYVEFEAGDLTASEVDSLPDLLSQSLAALVQEEVPTTVLYLDKAAAGEMCGCDMSSYSVDLVRVVELGGHPCPCGGTHVAVSEMLFWLTRLYLCHFIYTRTRVN
jgi:Ser-tRNA(Ala) deacylase AlaX